MTARIIAVLGAHYALVEREDGSRAVHRRAHDALGAPFIKPHCELDGDNFSGNGAMIEALLASIPEQPQAEAQPQPKGESDAAGPGERHKELCGATAVWYGETVDCNLPSGHDEYHQGELLKSRHFSWWGDTRTTRVIIPDNSPPLPPASAGQPEKETASPTESNRISNPASGESLRDFEPTSLKRKLMDAAVAWACAPQATAESTECMRAFESLATEAHRAVSERDALFAKLESKMVDLVLIKREAQSASDALAAAVSERDELRAERELYLPTIARLEAAERIISDREDHIGKLEERCQCAEKRVDELMRGRGELIVNYTDATRALRALVEAVGEGIGYDGPLEAALELLGREGR